MSVLLIMGDVTTLATTLLGPTTAPATLGSYWMRTTMDALVNDV